MPIHVLMLDGRGVLADIVRTAINGADDMKLLTPDADIDRADVVVTTTRDDELPLTIGDAAHLRVLGIDDRDQHGTLYRLDPSRAVLGELSVAGLTDAIRGAANEGRSVVFNWQPTG